MVGVVDRAAGKRGCVVARLATVAVVGDRHLYGGIRPNSGQGRVVRNRDLAVGIVDLAVRAGTPAEEHLVRRRRHGSGRIGMHLRLSARGIGQAVHGRGSARLAEIVGHLEIERAEPNGVQDHVFIDLHARVEQDQRAVLHDQPTAERIARVRFVCVGRRLGIRQRACADGSAIRNGAQINGRAAGRTVRHRVRYAGESGRRPFGIQHDVLCGHRLRPRELRSGQGCFGREPTAKRKRTRYAGRAIGRIVKRGDGRFKFNRRRRGRRVSIDERERIARTAIEQRSRKHRAVLRKVRYFAISLIETGDREVVLVVCQPNVAALDCNGLHLVVCNAVARGRCRSRRRCGGGSVQCFKIIRPGVGVALPLRRRHGQVAARHLHEERIVGVGQAGLPDISLIGKIQDRRNVPNSRDVLVVFIGLVIDRIVAVFIGQRIRLARMIDVQDRRAVAFDGLPRRIGTVVEVLGIARVQVGGGRLGGRRRDHGGGCSGLVDRLFKRISGVVRILDPVDQFVRRVGVRRPVRGQGHATRRRVAEGESGPACKGVARFDNRAGAAVLRSDIGIHRAECERGIRHDIHRRNIRSVDGIKRNPDHLFDDRVKVDIRVVHRHARADVGRAAGGQRPSHKRFVRADFERGHAVRRDAVARIRRARFGHGTELIIEEDIVGGFKLCSQRGRAVGCYRLCAKGIKFCVVRGKPADKFLSGGGGRNFRRIHRVAVGNDLGRYRCRTNHKGVRPERRALR